MKSIGIITFQRTIGNYGASLQCFALYEYLKRQGYNCEVIDLLRKEHSNYKESKRYYWPQKRRSFIRRLLSYVKWKIVLKLKKKVVRNNYSSIRIENFNNFNNRIKYSKQYQCIDNLYDDPPCYDIYLTGSDQVWNPTIGFYNEPYFLTFAPNGSRKVSYASSIALPSLPYEYHELYRKWLSNYKNISVREKEGKTIVQNLINKDVSVVLDPTFLLDISIWNELALTPTIEKRYLFVYTLMHNDPLIRYAIKKASEMGLEIILAMSTPQNTTFDKKIIFADNLGPLEWMGFIKEAEFVITDSFHGTAFSIMFGTPFYVYISLASRGSRILNLLDTLSLSNHCLSSDFQEKGNMEFDYQKTLKILNIERRLSESYLNIAING
ncbi:MAG: polysaccharide pyruvyl transferase family protein [Bacteroides sp.]|nr:polysaccharide pyruvyl transferase family protein [Bacteroides sp.]